MSSGFSNVEAEPLNYFTCNSLLYRSQLPLLSTINTEHSVAQYFAVFFVICAYTKCLANNVLVHLRFPQKKRIQKHILFFHAYNAYLWKIPFPVKITMYNAYMYNPQVHAYVCTCMWVCMWVRDKRGSRLLGDFTYGLDHILIN